jgi:serine/threonine protein kinase
MTELTSFLLERLWEDGELVLFRGKRDTDLMRVLVAAPALKQPAPEAIARLQHAYSLAGELDPVWATRPLELVRHEGRPALLMEDPGGDPLVRLLSGPMEPRQFLGIAIGIAVALGSLHARGLMHRNIKPGNILVDSKNRSRLANGFRHRFRSSA